MPNLEKHFNASAKTAELLSFVKEINQLNHGSATAFMAIQHDKIVLEYYDGYHSHLKGARKVQKDSLFNVASVRKSYLGLIVAYAVYEGKIKSIDDPVTNYLDNLNHQIMEGTTIRHLLTHTHGLSADQTGNIVRHFPGGTSWDYVDVGVNLLARLIKTVMGKSVAQLLREKIFIPLGFHETVFMTEKSEKLVQVIREPDQAPDWEVGTSAEGDQSNLFVSTRELAFWGYLHLKQGNLDGKQVVPKEVIQLSTAIQSPETLDTHYPLNGYLWFIQGEPSEENQLGERVPRGSYQIVGVTGPIVLVIPEYDLVVVRMYNKYYNYGGEDYLYYLREFGNRVVDGFRV